MCTSSFACRMPKTLFARCIQIHRGKFPTQTYRTLQARSKQRTGRSGPGTLGGRSAPDPGGVRVSGSHGARTYGYGSRVGIAAACPRRASAAGLCQRKNPIVPVSSPVQAPGTAPHLTRRRRRRDRERLLWSGVAPMAIGQGMPGAGALVPGHERHLSQTEHA